MPAHFGRPVRRCHDATQNRTGHGGPDLRTQRRPYGPYGKLLHPYTRQPYTPIPLRDEHIAPVLR